jgi:hypothetical protein
MRKLVVIAALCLAPSASHARVQVATYEGPDAIQTGTGGTKIAKDGIDYWTSGTPPRKYKVLGILTDERKDKLLSGHAIGSSGLAKKVLELGGNALIVLDQNSRNAGLIGGWGNGFAYGRQVHNITTQMLVVQYLD